jgi:ribosome maturation factor RimP
MSQTAIDAELEAELAAVAASSGCELAHVEFRGGTLRVFLDRPDGGVTLDDCSRVAREVSALLDVHDFGKRRYLLEVSSQGLDRELYGPRDYQRFRGRLIRASFEREGHKQTVVGRLEEFRRLDESASGKPTNGNADAGEISLISRDTGERFEIPLRDIRVARLEVEL